MPPTLDHEMAFDDDDGMPPLVDNPLPPMTFTFTADLPPITYNYDVATSEQLPEAAATDMSMYPPPDTSMIGFPRGSHAKKRDASYIPRPPNAFILFRSSFIRAQHIPGAIEGNHSALSKIIGKCWKALPREERQVWEAKALVALAEHRKKYPDWRFKPTANALAKVKDGPRKRGNRKGRGQSEKEERSREKRCAKIADLLVAGKSGSDLAAAVEQYDCEVGGRGRKLKDECVGVSFALVQEEIRDGAIAYPDVKAHTVVRPQVPNAAPLSVVIGGVDVKPPVPRSALDGRFNVPLTAMFKRSSSAPAPRARSPPDIFQHRRDSFSAAPPTFTRAASFDNAGVVREEMSGTGFDSGASREGTGHVSADSVSSIQTYNPGASAPLIFPRNAGRAAIGVNDADLDGFSLVASPYPSPHIPEFEPDVDGFSSPVQSPIATPVMYGWGQESDVGSPASISDMMGEAYTTAPSPSSYSSLEGWAGSPLPKQASPISSPLPIARVCHYVDGTDSPSILAKAFDAAASAVSLYDCEWHESLGLDAVGSAHAFYPWASGSESDTGAPEDVFSIAHCRQDDF